jgi:hypothetical protein
VAYSVKEGLKQFSSLSELNEAQRNVDDYVFPLLFIGGKYTDPETGKDKVYVTNLQGIPQVQYFEEGLQ